MTIAHGVGTTKTVTRIMRALRNLNRYTMIQNVQNYIAQKSIIYAFDKQTKGKPESANKILTRCNTPSGLQNVPNQSAVRLLYDHACAKIRNRLHFSKTNQDFLNLYGFAIICT